MTTTKLTHTTYDSNKDRFYLLSLSSPSMAMEEIIKSLYGMGATPYNVPAVSFDLNPDRTGIIVSFRDPYSYSRAEKKIIEKRFNIKSHVVSFTRVGRYVNATKIKTVVADIQKKSQPYFDKKENEQKQSRELDMLRNNLKKDMGLEPTDSLMISGSVDKPIISLIMVFHDVTSAREMYKLGRHILSL